MSIYKFLLLASWLFTVVTHEAVAAKPHPSTTVTSHTTALPQDVEGQSIQHFQQLIEQKKFTAAQQVMMKFSGDPLDPYVRYLWLNAQANQRPIEELADYVKQYPFGGWTNQLKLQWSEQLVKDKQWSTLTRWSWLFDKGDARCRVLEAQSQLNRKWVDNDWLDEVADRWQNTTITPQACIAIEQKLMTAHHVTETQWQNKLSLLLSQQKLKEVTALIPYMPESIAAEYQKLLTALKDPATALNQLQQSPPDSIQQRHFMHLMRELALKQPDQAIPLWQEGKARLNIHALVADRFERLLYVSMSKKDKANATEWLKKIPPQQQDETSLLPLINEALQASDWSALTQYLSWLPAHMMHEDRWLYWQAKALDKLGQNQEAQTILQELATHRSFYGFMAADILGKPYQLNTETPAQDTIDRVAQAPLLNTLRALYIAGLKEVAWKEWRYYQLNGQVSLNDTPAYAYHALSWGWTAFSVLSLGNPQHWNYVNLRFPMPYQHLLQEKSQSHDIPLAWSYGIMRRESAYAPMAKSSSGALGLMQLMPKTAKALHPIKNINDVYDPTLNVHLGTKLLGQLKREFNQQLVFATASYNAGGFRVRQWIKKNPDLPLDQWIELIPYKETRDYVKAVMEYMLVFERLGGLPNTQLTHYLQPIQPASVVEVACNPDKEWCL